MTQPESSWRITQDATNDAAYALLARDPVWNCLALADLEPPLRQYSQFAVASRDDGDERALCLILRHPIIGDVLSPFGHPAGIAALLRHLALPERPVIQAQEMHLPVLQRAYQPETMWRSMLRMAITAPATLATMPAPPRPVRRLTPADLPALNALYAEHPDSVFSPDLFAEGLYVGAYDGERIVAAGGTHTLTPAYRIAVLGHILTAPDARGQGYATAITAALVTALFAQGIATVALNVLADNTTAIRVYERVGFQTHHRLVAGRAILAK